MLQSQSFPTQVARSYGLVDTELDAFEAGLRGVQPHPNNPNAYALWRPKRKEAPRAFGCMELILDTWTDPNDSHPMGIALECNGEFIWLDGIDDTALAGRFWSALSGTMAKVNVLVVWNGEGVVFHTFLRHLARPLAKMGATILPMVSGVDIKAITIKGSGVNVTLTATHSMAGLTKLDQESFCESFGGGCGPGERRVTALNRAVNTFQKVLLSSFGVGIRPTIAAVALKAARYYLPEGSKWFRPNLALESVCRYGGAYRGGYVYSEPYHGPAWRIDVNKMYTNLLRSPLPSGCVLTHAGEYLREKAGIFLCRVQGESHFPVYVSAYSPTNRRFHKERSASISVWAWLPSAEFKGLRAIGYQVQAGLGFAFTDWISLRGYADHLLALQTRYERGSPESLVAKMMGNALVGKLGQATDHLDVCYSIGEPSGGWLPYVTAEREVVSDLWIKRSASFSGGQHVDAAAWLTAMGRGVMYAQLSRIQSLGWRAVHVDTDGVIVDQDPRAVLPLSVDRPGSWRFDGFDPNAMVAKAKWYSFQGEQHTAGVSGVTREQLEAVHYGRKVVIGRKVLSSPLTKGTMYQTADYHLGG